MDMSVVAARGLVLLGCGKMGSAMLAGWLEQGLDMMAEDHRKDAVRRKICTYGMKVKSQ